MTRRAYSLRVHPAGLAALLLALLFGRADVALAACVALLCHEGAHVLCMLACGVKRCEVELTPFGGMADADGFERLPYLKQLCVALSGVAASALLGWLCLRFAPIAPFWWALANLNLSLALINCLPLWPLDGARAVMAVATKLGFAPVALRAMRALAILCAALLVALGLYGAWLGHVNLSLLMIGPYLAYASRQSAAGGALGMLRRVDEASSKLRAGSTLPARALVCQGEPDASTLARLFRRMPEGRYHMLYVLDGGGRVVQTFTERQLAERLLEGSQNL